ncbi:MAG: hypothetical protein WCO52_03590 [bacterium]
MEKQPEPEVIEKPVETTSPVAVSEPGKKPILVIVGLVAVTAVGAGVAYAILGRSKTSVAPVASSTPALTATTNATAATPTATPTPTPAGTTISVKEEGKLILPGGYADPTVVPYSGGFRMYVNSFGHGPSGYLTYTSPDGVTWTKEKGIIISGVATGRAIVLPTGIRFYYPGMQPIKPSDPQADMLSSFSSDGITWKKDAGTILSPRSNLYYVEGPTVFQLPDKTWRMYFNENTVAAGNNRDGSIWGASSADGTTWKRDAALTLEADGVTETGTTTWKQALHPFVVTNPKGGYIMFYNAHSELYAATSTDGLTWKKIGKIGVHGADADGYFLADGTFRLFYGGFSEKDGGLIYMAVLNVK